MFTFSNVGQFLMKTCAIRVCCQVHLPISIQNHT